MKKLLIASLLSASLTSAAFAADTRNFEGFSAGLNLNLMSTGIKVSGDGYKFDGVGGRQTQTVSIEPAYGWKIGSDSVLTVGADLDLNKPTVLDVDIDLGGGPIESKLKMRKHYGVYVAPGYAITPMALAYVKLGTKSMELYGDGGSEKFRGTSFGFGTKVMISGSTFLKVEAAREMYKSKDIDVGLGGAGAKPSATVGTIGIGWNFK